MPEDATGCKCSSLPMLRPRHLLGPLLTGGVRCDWPRPKAPWLQYQSDARAVESHRTGGTREGPAGSAGSLWRACRADDFSPHAPASAGYKNWLQSIKHNKQDKV